MLVKAGLLKTLEQNISPTKAFEIAMQDQNEISGVSDIAGLQMSAYRQQRRAQDTKGWRLKQDPSKMRVEVELDQVIGHRYTLHGARMCRACGKQNNFKRVCQLKGKEKQGTMQCIEDEEATLNPLIAHIVFNPVTWTYKLGNTSLEELEGTLIPFSPCPDPKWIRDFPTKLKIYPDSGATMCLGRLTHLQHVGLSERNLVPSKKKRYALSEDFPCYVKVGYLSCSKLGVEPQNRVRIYATKYK